MALHVRDVPISVTSYSKEFMASMDAHQVQDMYPYLTGVQQSDVSGYDLTIRGFSSSSEDPNTIIYQ